MPKPVDKPCANCGQMMHGVHPGRKYCPECKKEQMRIRARTYWNGKHHETQHKQTQEARVKKKQAARDSLSQVVHTLALLNEERHLAGLPALSYGQYVRMKEGMR